MENLLTIEDIEILIQAIDDWLTAEQLQASADLLTLASYATTPEELEKLKDKIQAMKIQTADIMKKQKETAVLLQAKLVNLKQAILHTAFNGLEDKK